MKESKNYYSVSELAGILGVSRITVFKKIKNRQIYAEKVGRNYIIPKDKIEGILRGGMTEKMKGEIEEGVKKVIQEYGETLKMLGKE